MNYLRKYQTFATKQEMNEAISLHLNDHKQQLNKTDQHVLTLLSRYAVKYPGVAHLKLATIAQAVHKSDRTVRRSLEKLERMNILKRQTFLREKTGGTGANLYILLPYKQTVEPTTKVEIKKAEPIPKPTIQHTYVEDHITHYERFQNLIKSHIGEDNKALASQLYGIFRVHTIRLLKFSIHEGKEELFESISLQAVRILFQTTKKKAIHNLAGYYDGIFRKLIEKALFAEAFMDYDVPMEVKIPV